MFSPEVGEEVKKAIFPPEVIEEVRKYIKARGYTTERFADITGVSASTLYRFFRGEPISHQSLVAIYKAMHGGDHVEVLKAFARQNPENKALQEAVDCYKNLRLTSELDPELIEFFRRDALTYRIYLLLTYNEGISREIVRDEMGKMGLELFDELLGKNKLLEVKPGCYRLANNRVAFGDGEVLQTACGRLFEVFDPDTYLSDHSQIAHFSGWISEKGYADAKQELLGACHRIITILGKNPGPIPFAAATGLIKILDDINFKKNSEGLS